MKKLFIVSLIINFIFLIHSANIYANNQTNKLIQSLFKDKKEKFNKKNDTREVLENKSVNTKTIFFKDPIELMPNIVDALEEKRLYNYKGSKINIKKVNIFAINDTDYLRRNKITIISDYSIPSWQISCVLKDNDATSFLEKSKGRTALTLQIIGIVKDYSRSNGMILDPCTFN